MKQIPVIPTLYVLNREVWRISTPHLDLSEPNKYSQNACPGSTKSSKYEFSPGFVIQPCWLICCSGYVSMLGISIGLFQLGIAKLLTKAFEVQRVVHVWQDLWGWQICGCDPWAFHNCNGANGHQVVVFKWAYDANILTVFKFIWNGGLIFDPFLNRDDELAHVKTSLNR